MTVLSSIRVLPGEPGREGSTIISLRSHTALPSSILVQVKLLLNVRLSGSSGMRVRALDISYCVASARTVPEMCSFDQTVPRAKRRKGVHVNVVVLEPASVVVLGSSFGPPGGYTRATAVKASFNSYAVLPSARVDKDL